MRKRDLDLLKVVHDSILDGAPLSRVMVDDTKAWDRMCGKGYIKLTEHKDIPQVALLTDKGKAAIHEQRS